MAPEVHSLLPQSGTSPYGALMITGIVISLMYWIRLTRRDERLTLVYLGGLAGAFLGAKLVYLLSEGWLYFSETDALVHLLIGKSILGAFLGGYASVEAIKYVVGYTRPTGDWFALIAPIGIILGRIGCLQHGCCLGEICEPAWYTLTDSQGQARWPVVPLELGFNIIALTVAFALRSKRFFAGQLFHLYLIAYGLFRFTHEFWRDTPKILGTFSGYQVASLAVFILGAIGFRKRALKTRPRKRKTHSGNRPSTEYP